jgi:hypothetical protein
MTLEQHGDLLAARRCGTRLATTSYRCTSTPGMILNLGCCADAGPLPADEAAALAENLEFFRGLSASQTSPSSLPTVLTFLRYLTHGAYPAEPRAVI